MGGKPRSAFKTALLVCRVRANAVEAQELLPLFMEADLMGVIVGGKTREIHDNYLKFKSVLALRSAGNIRKYSPTTIIPVSGNISGINSPWNPKIFGTSPLGISLRPAPCSWLCCSFS